MQQDAATSERRRLCVAKGHNQAAGGVWARLNSLTHSTLDPKGAEVNALVPGVVRRFSSTAEFEGSPIVRSRPSRFLSVVRKTVTRRARAGPLDNRASPRQQGDAGKRNGLVTLVTYSAGVRSRAGRSTQDSAAPTGSGVGGDPSLSHDE